MFCVNSRNKFLLSYFFVQLSLMFLMLLLCILHYLSYYLSYLFSTLIYILISILPICFISNYKVIKSIRFYYFSGNYFIFKTFFVFLFLLFIIPLQTHAKSIITNPDSVLYLITKKHTKLSKSPKYEHHDTGIFLRENVKLKAIKY